MQPLRQALEAGTAHGYEQSGYIAEKPARGPFRQWLVKLFGSKDKGPIYTQQSVARNLKNDYGETVGRRVMVRVGKKSLTARRITQLHSEAVKLKHAMDKHNNQHARSWMNLDKPESMASQLFTSIHGYEPRSLPEYERNRLQLHLEAAFYDKADHELSRLEASQLVADTLTLHDTAFAEATPSTARMLGYGEEFGRGGFYPLSLDQWFENVPLNDYDRNLVRAFQFNSSHSARISNRSPFKLLTKQPWADQIDSTKDHITRLKSSLSALQRGALLSVPETLRQAMAFDIYHQINQGQQHIQFLESLERADFRSETQLRKAEEHMLDTALLVAHDSLEKARIKGQTEKEESLKNVIWKLNDRKDGLGTKEQPSAVFMRKVIQAEVKELKKALQDAGVHPRDIKKGWRKASAAIANNREWKTIEKVVPVRAGGVLHQYTSRLVPAGQMRFTPPEQSAGDRDPFPQSYSGRGRSSADPMERTHAINLYENEVHANDGRCLYRGLRHGTLYSHKTTDKAKQQSTLENRAMEVVRAAFVQKFSALPPEKQQEIIDGAPLPFDLVVTSLLSPDEIRHRTGIHDDELVYQQAQNQIMQNLCDEPVTMDIMDSNGHSHTVTADIRLTTLNIPVNNLGLNPVLSGVGRTWETADAYNQIGFEKLFGNTHPDADIGGVVGEWLRGPGLNSPDREKVLQLVHQIRTMYSQGLHHMEGRDAYKLAVRVQLLAFMIDAIPDFSCKSGKDRTGETDSRTKEFAAEVDRLGYVPDPQAPPTQEHQEAVQSFLYGAGNLEVQQQNIGMPYFKTETGREELGDELFELIH